MNKYLYIYDDEVQGVGIKDTYRVGRPRTAVGVVCWSSVCMAACMPWLSFSDDGCGQSACALSYVTCHPANRPPELVLPATHDSPWAVSPWRSGAEQLYLHLLILLFLDGFDRNGNTRWRNMWRWSEWLASAVPSICDSPPGSTMPVARSPDLGHRSGPDEAPPPSASHVPRRALAVGYNMGLAHIIFNKSNKTLWYVTLSVVWFNTIRDFDWTLTQLI